MIKLLDKKQKPFRRHQLTVLSSFIIWFCECTKLIYLDIYLNLKNTFENFIFNAFVTEDILLDDDVDPDARSMFICIHKYYVYKYNIYIYIYIYILNICICIYDVYICVYVCI